MGGEGNLFFAGGEGGVNPKRRKKKPWMSCRHPDHFGGCNPDHQVFIHDIFRVPGIPQRLLLGGGARKKQ